MKVKYYFRQLSPLDGIFNVVYYNDEMPDGFERNIGLPWDETGEQFCKGDDLHKYVMAHCPWYEFKMVKMMMDVDTSYIEKIFQEQDPELL